MPALAAAAAALIFLVLAANAVVYWDRRGAVRLALRAALERGDIRPEEYAAHLRALDEAA